MPISPASYQSVMYRCLGCQRRFYANVDPGLPQLAVGDLVRFVCPMCRESRWFEAVRIAERPIATLFDD